MSDMEIVEYDISWKELYKAEEKTIKNKLKKNCFAVKHIGSTAVKGLASRPFIDILVAINDFTKVEDLEKEIIAAGYEKDVDKDLEGRRIYVKKAGSVGYNLYMYDKMKRDEIGKHVALRDYLISCQDEAQAYGEFKKKLMLECSGDNHKYLVTREEYLNDLENKAMAWKQKNEKQGTAISLGMCIGLSIGMSIGSAFGNPSVGMCMGMAVGVCIGALLGQTKEK